MLPGHHTRERLKFLTCPVKSSTQNRNNLGNNARSAPKSTEERVKIV
jgi:hypothetical protein